MLTTLGLPGTLERLGLGSNSSKPASQRSVHGTFPGFQGSTDSWVASGCNILLESIYANMSLSVSSNMIGRLC